MKLSYAHRLLACLVAFPALIYATPASAWDGVQRGTIAQIDITDGNNHAFRVNLAGAPQMCTGGATWASINETDSNYKVYVAALLMAKAQGSAVTIFSTQVGVFCKIGHLAIH